MKIKNKNKEQESSQSSRIISEYNSSPDFSSVQHERHQSIMIRSEKKKSPKISPDQKTVLITVNDVNDNLNQSFGGKTVEDDTGNDQSIIMTTPENEVLEHNSYEIETAPIDETQKMKDDERLESMMDDLKKSSQDRLNNIRNVADNVLRGVQESNLPDEYVKIIKELTSTS